MILTYSTSMKVLWRKLLPLLLLLAMASLLYVSFSATCDHSAHDNNFYRDSPGKLHHTPLDAGAYGQPDKPHKVHQLNGFDDIGDQKAGGVGGGELPYEDMECLINGDYTVGCRREGGEVYVPFSFLQSYFEVFGKLKEAEGTQAAKFEWSHSYSTVYPPKEKYTPGGEFMSFRHYNVEVRERVKCISGVEGVPISTQWGVQGYYYPIQIAQYGLSHYSKYLVEERSDRTVSLLEDGENELVYGGRDVTGVWDVPKGARLSREYDAEAQSYVVSFDTSASASGVKYSLPLPPSKNLYTLCLDVIFASTNGTIAVEIELKGKQPAPRHTLLYTLGTELIQVRAAGGTDGAGGGAIVYGIGPRTHWSRLTRDLAIDFQKGLMLKKGSTAKQKGSGKVSIQRVVSITLIGRGALDNVTLANNAHLAQFYYAANWLVLHQDEHGGWPILVTRKLAAGLLEMPPGWYSAMAQGQAMSLLVRAYIRTHNQKYLDAALRATHLFDVPSSDGGVLAKFAGKYNWYEEYPTTPSVFVLNGFIYSLIGLYDVKTIVGREQGSDASRLYATGLSSLKQLLPLFDTGSGTIYDLRHFALGSAPNLARWDYHTTHINQLLLLATIEDDLEDKLFESTAKRWIGYMKGQRAPHN